MRLTDVHVCVCTQEYNISNGDESEAERLERLLVEEAVARRIEVGVSCTKKQHKLNL